MIHTRKYFHAAALVMLLVSAYISIYTAFRWTSIFIFIIFSVEIYFVIKFIRMVFSVRFRLKTIVALGISIAVYGLLEPTINNLELWFDEIIVIQTAHLPLYRIAHEIMAHYVIIPPLDFWHMWAWKYVADIFHPEFHEFVYRMPYMAYHTISGLLFAITVDAQFGKKQTGNIVFFILFYLLYFLNPLLFIYSIEIRNYGLIELGIVVILYFYTTNRLFKPAYIIPTLLFCLNSIYQFLVLTPFVLLVLYSKHGMKKVLPLVIGATGLALCIFPALWFPNPLNPTDSTGSFSVALQRFYGYQITQPIQIISYIFLLIYTMVFGAKKQTVFIVVCVVFYVVSMFVANTAINYVYFSWKHFLFISPFLLYLIARPDLHHMTPLRYIYILLLVMLICPWWSQIKLRIDPHNSISKGPVGAKEIFVHPPFKQGTILIFPKPITDTFDHYFDDFSLSWYAQRQTSILYINFLPYEPACRLFNTAKGTVMYYSDQTTECGYAAPTKQYDLFRGKLVTHD